MNGYNDIHVEPTTDDEEFALAYGYEIISEEELNILIHLSCSRRSSSEEAPPPTPASGFSLFRRNSSKKLQSKGSVSSFNSTSTQSSGVSSMMGKPLSSGSLSSQGSGNNFHHDHDDIEEEKTEHEYLTSVERIWYMFQQKRHHHDEVDEGIKMADQRILTMEDSSNGKKLTSWFHNLVHFPERMRQLRADKHRFNIDNAPRKIRDELKHIYVY